MELNIFRDFAPRGTRMGEPGNGNPWINFDLEIPIAERNRLYDHILNCAGTKLHINGIRGASRMVGIFMLPIIEGPEFREHLIETVKHIPFHPDLKKEFINQQERIINLVTTDRLIIGIQTQYGLPILTVEEVAEFKSCMESYVSLEDKMRNYEHHIEEGDWNEDAFIEFMDPVTWELLRDPVIASDGHTYSKETLINLFNGNRLSPITREELTPIGKRSAAPSFTYNGIELGIPNFKVKQLLEKFTEGKLKVSQQKYLKYKTKYLNLKKSINN